tara:strand:- start:4745 stop:5380 length:636 start_codon:yes stop_codon:yes gene_type:complete
MSQQLIFIIVGALFILLALISANGKDSSSKSLASKLKVFFGVVGILLIIYGGYAYENNNLQAPIEQVNVGNKLQVELPAEKIQIISPLQDDAVACRILTMGVYPVAHDKDIWVVLKPSDDKYYPQSDHTNTSYKRNGEWQVITRFGGDKDESYEIITYETDATASDFFSATILSWKNSESYSGLSLEEIPEGAKEVDRITVSLQENCRGVH